jgi:hypothetical protein
MTDKDVIVTNQGSSAGALVAGIVAVLLIALAVWYFGFNPQSQDGEADLEVPVPTTAAP